MAYVTYDEYLRIMKGEPVDEADFPALLDQASEIIEEMTVYRVSEDVFQKMAPDLQALIQKAVCAQINYLDANGGEDLDNGTDLQSASVGKFSYTRASAGASGNSGQSVYSLRAQRILAPTGLLYRGGWLL